jgi:hypothetical protein
MKCKYYEFAIEHGVEYNLCKHPDKQDPESDFWSMCDYNGCDESDE